MLMLSWLNPQNLPAAAHPESVRVRLSDILAEKQGPEAEFFKQLQKDTTGKALLDAILGNSPYLSRIVQNDPAWFRILCEKGPAAASLDIYQALDALKNQDLEQAALMEQLRRAKARIALLIAVADISQFWDVFTVTNALSEFADRAIQLALHHVLNQGYKKKLIAIPGGLENCGITVLALGKLGAQELNYSSDIDLAIFYDPTKIAYHGRLTLQQFLNQATHDFSNILQQRTGAGYVFRVDLRLRPDPASMPPAVSLPAAEAYYESVGQNWERAAMIKARHVAGDPATGARFLNFIEDFIWRRYLDFESIQDIHSIKRQIQSRRDGESITLPGYNIKIGRGGIREIEFFAVTQQLIWGGKQANLRERRTLDAMRELENRRHIDGKTRAILSEAYVFYRKLEHRLQMVADEQTHTLPKEPEQFRQIAIFMGYNDAESFSRDLLAKINTVTEIYDTLFQLSPSLGSAIKEKRGNLVFTGVENDPQTLETLKNFGFENPATISEIIRGWHHGRRRATRTKRAREVITEITPALLAAFCDTPYPDYAFTQFDEVLTRLPSSVQIFSIFYNNPDLMELFATMMGSYPHITEILRSQPELLESLLARDFYDAYPEPKEVHTALRERLLKATDFEAKLDAARRFARRHWFRLGVHLQKGLITIDTVSAHLSHLADALITELQREVTTEFSAQYGTVESHDFAVIAMGKLGSQTLTFSSDLDLVFVYSAPENAKPGALSTGEYFTRLCRRLMTALTTQTNQGKLYDIDIRLRPSGKDGPIAVSLEGFAKYYQNSAWLWEDLALTRARVITGSTTMKTRIEDMIRAVITRPRDPTDTAREVLDMRAKIAEEYGNHVPLNIKYARGGLIDVEFLAEYQQICFSHRFPDLITQNLINLFTHAAAHKLITPQDRDALEKAAHFYHHVQFIQRLIYFRDYDETKATAQAKKTLVEHLQKEHPELQDFTGLMKQLISHQKNVQKCTDSYIRA